MAEATDSVLIIKNVSRIYPRDISDTPSSMLREMFLPKTMLKYPNAKEFFALKDINFELRKGQKLGVIGLHRSGKSTLAGIASSILLPTTGTVTTHGSKLLLSRPAAGFKPALTVFENLAFRAMLAGRHGQELKEIITNTLSRCGVSYSDAQTPIGNLSPYLAKQLGMSLLLEIPADILIIDELSGAGMGGARWETRGRLQDKIEKNTTLIISSDPAFLDETTDESLLLHNGLIYGPFETRETIKHYNRLPDEDCYQSADYDPLQPPVNPSYLGSITKKQNGAEIDSTHLTPGENKPRHMRSVKRTIDAIANIEQIIVDGDEYQLSRIRLLRTAGEWMHICVKLTTLREIQYEGIAIRLHSPGGVVVGSKDLIMPEAILKEHISTSVEFRIKIPDLPKNHYGLSFSFIDKNGGIRAKNQLKILVYGLFTPSVKTSHIELDVINCCTNTSTSTNKTIEFKNNQYASIK